MSKDIFVSIRGRILLNVEALNMTESVGNYVKHRKVPVMLQLQNGFVVNFVPAVSGESIAHGFQKVLVDEALKNNLPVCKLCKSGIFLKSTDSKVVKEAFGLDEKEFKDKESFIIRNCIVEDVGGFLYAEEENVKRTSNFYVGYMIPAKEVLENTVIEPQLHSRYALGTSFVKTKDQEQTKGQMIYYVELSSTLYTFSFDLDTRYISKTTFKYEDVGKLAVEETERINRIKITLDALKKFLIELPFGAKKSRFLPTGEWNSLVIAVSDDVWTVGSPFTAKYIENTNKKLEKVSYNTKLFIYDGNKESIEETITNAIEEAKSRVNQ